MFDGIPNTKEKKANDVIKATHKLIFVTIFFRLLLLLLLPLLPYDIRIMCQTKEWRDKCDYLTIR